MNWMIRMETSLPFMPVHKCIVCYGKQLMGFNQFTKSIVVGGVSNCT